MAHYLSGFERKDFLEVIRTVLEIGGQLLKRGLEALQSGGQGAAFISVWLLCEMRCKVTKGKFEDPLEFVGAGCT